MIKITEAEAIELYENNKNTVFIYSMDNILMSNTIFYDPYLFYKKYTVKDKLYDCYPIDCIDKDTDGNLLLYKV